MAIPSSTHRGWWRDIPNDRLVAVWNGSREWAYNGSAVFPITNDGSALGTTSLGWADVHLATGAVINWANGEITLTGAANSLTFAGGDFLLGSGIGINVGSITQATISDGDGTTNLIPEVQALGVGTAFAGGAVAIGTFNTTNDRTVSPKLAFIKGGAATQVATTAVADNEVVGSIIAYGADGTDFESPVAAIEFVINGGVGTGDMPGSIEFYTTADGGETLTLSFSVDTDQNIYVRNTNGIVVGHTAQITFNALVPEVQVLGTAVGADGALAIALYSATAAQGAELILGRSKSATLGTNTIVADGDAVGTIRAVAADGGTGFDNAATIVFTVSLDNGSASLTDGRIGANIAFWTMPVLTTPTLTRRMQINNLGGVTIDAASTPSDRTTSAAWASMNALAVTGGVGGATTIATTGEGGIGGGFSFTGGAGGVADSATTASTGGAGGAFVSTTGAGGATAVAGTTSTGGAGGAITLTTGAGGAVSLAVSGTATGGAAGLLTIRGGVGGAVTATTGTNVGGAGGGISIIAGAGGAASGATDTGGAGGILTLTPGAGGTGDANAAGKPGYINITTSYTRRSVQTIDMADAAVTLTVVPGNPTGTLMTSDVLYVDANSATTENLLLPHEADLTGIILVIVNTGGETINIQNDAGGAVLTLETANTAFLTCDGTTLRGVVGVP